jgi:hypothetical protein
VVSVGDYFREIIIIIIVIIGRYSSNISFFKTVRSVYLDTDPVYFKFVTTREVRSVAMFVTIYT